MSILADPTIASFLENHANHRFPGPPIAVFDCDGTVIKGDVGEAMLYYQLEHFCFKVSPAEVWPDHPKRGALDTLFNKLSAMESHLRTDTRDFVEFADIVISWYVDQIAEGNVEKACANIVQLFAGFTLDEVRDISEKNLKHELHSHVGERALCGRKLPQGIRFIRESVQLISALKKRGFQIWAVSGSNKWSVEPVFRKLGVSPERVIGIELASRNGVFTSEVLEPVPIRAKKVDALQQRQKGIPLLVASDSRNDIPLFKYASGLRVLVNSRKRSTDIFFSSGDIARDDTWVIIEHPTVESEDAALWQTYQ